MNNNIKMLALSMLIMGITNNIYAADKSSNTQATASIEASCRMAISPMSFGDVSMQAMSGNGDITAQTTLDLICTKDATVTLKTNYGVNGTAGATSFNYQNAQIQRTAPYAGSDSSNFFNASQADINYALSNGYTYLVSGYANSTQLYYRDYIYWRVVYSDGSLIPPGAPYPVAGSNMISGVNKIAYGISTTPTGAYLTSTSGSPITYTKNDGTAQSFPLYGRANVKQAAPGTYVDTNTLTVTF